METAARRPWETTSPPKLPHSGQTLPSIATLTSKLPSPTNDRGLSDLSILPPQRDSGSWMTPGTLSGSSIHSGNSMPYLNSAHSPNGPGQFPHTPEATSAPPAPFNSASHHPNGFPTPTSDGNPLRGSGDFDDSRRSSVTNSIHQHMNNLGLGGPTSPYTSNNASQTSLASGLQRERGIQPNGYQSGRYSMGNSISSIGSRNVGRPAFVPGRVAPPILENPKKEVYSADAPTRGQAYAFPDHEPASGRNSEARPPSMVSRRGSFAGSYTSSVLTMESSRLPPGQQELPDAHHHSLQHKHIDSMRSDPDSPNGQTPYSRTPELRITHKLAERKRRSEMKDCFEQLRLKLPTSQNNKSSKWETLSRAIDYISQLESQRNQQNRDLDKQRHQLQDMEAKILEMNQQLQRMQHSGSFPPPPPNAMPQNPLEYGSHYNGNDPTSDTARTLPPLINGAMQGIQYSDNRR